MKCSNPIEASVLADYWFAALSSAGEESVEEHLLACDACGERLREWIALAEGVRRLAREGSLRMVVTDTFLQRAAARGLRVREYKVPSGGSVECTVGAEDDILIARLATDLAGAGRVDLCICDSNGVEQLRMPDIPFDAGAGSLVFQESITLAKAAPTNRMIVRLMAVDEQGVERPAGEYTFHHTRTLPGPGAW